MRFQSRKEAGKELGEALSKYRAAPRTIVLGLARGGVAVAYEVAKYLHLPLDCLAPRKIGAPGNPEFALGASLGDAVFLDEESIQSLHLSKEEIEPILAKEKKEAKRRLDLFRKGRETQNFKGYTVIVVDDGIATGATMKVSILFLKKGGAQKMIVAVPVAPKETIEELKKMADEVVCLFTPEPFMAVGQFYDLFPQVEDEEVTALLRESHG